MVPLPVRRICEVKRLAHTVGKVDNGLANLTIVGQILNRSIPTLSAPTIAVPLPTPLLVTSVTDLTLVRGQVNDKEV